MCVQIQSFFHTPSANGEFSRHSADSAIFLEKLGRLGKFLENSAILKVSTNLSIFCQDWTFFFCNMLHFLKGSAFFPRLSVFYADLTFVTYVKRKTLRSSEFSIMPSVVTKYQVYSMDLALKVCQIIRNYLVAHVSKHCIKITESAE